MRKTFTGKVSDSGKLLFYGSVQLNKFLNGKEGKRVLITVEVEQEKASVFSQTYFKKVICGAFVEIFASQFGEHINEDIASQRLREWCPRCNDDGETIALENLSQAQINILIEHSKMIASEQFDTFIPD